MAEARDLQLFRWRGEILHGRLPQLKQRLRTCAVTMSGLLIVALVISMLWKPRPLLVWNASASAPIGLYAVAPPTKVQAGEMVIAWTPTSVRTLAAGRRYLPSNVPLLKRVAAASGDRVCAIGKTISVNGRYVAARREVDGKGRPMPWWAGCRDLAEGELFLLMDSQASFDGRYFGTTKKEQQVGRAVLLWAR